MQSTYGPADDNPESFQKHAIVVDSGSSKILDGEPSYTIHPNGASVSSQNTDINERYPTETTGNHRDCSTSQIENLKVLQRIKSHGIGERNKRKRWRGRHEEIEMMSEIFSASDKQEVAATALVTSINIS